MCHINLSNVAKMESACVGNDCKDASAVLCALDVVLRTCIRSLPAKVTKTKVKKLTLNPVGCS